MLRLGMDGRTDDVLLAVNEAVANAVMHAYPTQDGRVDLDLSETDGVVIIVRDYGRGPFGHDDTAGGGFGIGIMRAVADSAHVTAPTDGGTEVRLSFHG
jgi:two-component sensor histidine kinase